MPWPFMALMQPWASDPLPCALLDALHAPFNNLSTTLQGGDCCTHSTDESEEAVALEFEYPQPQAARCLLFSHSYSPSTQ